MISVLLRAAVWLVPAAVYVAILLLLEVEQGATFWTSVGFLALAYLVLAVSFVAVPRSRIAAILGTPLILVSSIYFITQLVAATVFIYAPGIPYPVVMVSPLVLAAAYLVMVMFITTMSSNQKIVGEAERQPADVLVIKSAVARITALARIAHDPRLVTSLEMLAEEFRHSPTMRSNQVREADEQIAAHLAWLETLVHIQVTEEDAVGQVAAISEALASRNEAIKLRQWEPQEGRRADRATASGSARPV